jgi:hypothetical protein
MPSHITPNVTHGVYRHFCSKMALLEMSCSHAFRFRIELDHRHHKHDGWTRWESRVQGVPPQPHWKRQPPSLNCSFVSSSLSGNLVFPSSFELRIGFRPFGSRGEAALQTLLERNSGRVHGLVAFSHKRAARWRCLWRLR